MLCAYPGDKYLLAITTFVVISLCSYYYLCSNSMASQGLLNTIKVGKVNLRFDIAGLPVCNCVLCVG